MHEVSDLTNDEESLRLLLESVVDYAIIRLGPDGTALTWNKGGRRHQLLSIYQSVTVITCIVATATTLSGCAVIPSITASDSFMPHGYCLAWNPQLLALFIVGNILVALSYYSIPAALWILIRGRKDLAFNWIFRLFAAFIFWCGTTHVMKVWTIWYPNYWAEGLVDLITGVISVYTAVVLWPLIPKALAIRSPKQWEEANARLQESLEQRNQADKALRENQELTELIIDSANDAFIAIDPSGIITDWNAQADKTFGWSRSEVLGHPLSETIIPVQHRDAHTRGLRHFLSTGEGPVLNQRIETSALNKGGHEFPVEVSIFSVRMSTNTALCALIHDITERKKAEEDLGRAKDKALEASRFKSEFLTSMSHEIRTPMNGIIGMTEILLRSTLSEAQYKYAATIKDSCNSLLAVINDILDFSKVEAGKLTLESIDMEPVKLVEDVAELLAAQAKQKGISLLTFIDPEIPHLVRSDPLRLRQILINLVGNAVKFSHKGEVLVRACLEADPAGQKKKIKFSVTDRGPGMTEAQIANLFQPFVQGDGSVPRTYGGTGLGLTISKRLVELLHGEISVLSVKDYGSTFSFCIPVEESQQVPSEKRDSADLNGVRILVVDDQQSAREITQDYLQRWGMRAGTAESADQAFAKLKECAADDPYELVIVDLIMPDTDGLHFGKKVREIDVLQNTKLILVTAFDKPGIGEEAISLGFDAYLTKPIRQSELLDAITSILRESKDAQAPRAKAIEPRPGASRPPLHRRNDLILVAEDHPINQEVAFLLLHELGFEAHMAANGEEVLALLKRAPYAAIFMDCQMPVLDGFDATRAIRKSELRTGKHIPIIAMTAHAIEGSREQCLASGMDDYISKPISMQQLQVAIEKWLPAELETGDSPSQPNKVSNWLNLLHQKYGKSGSARLLSLLWEEVPKQIKQLEAAITIADLGNLLMVAHGLKGSCQSVFARDMDALCAKIETAALNEDWEEAAKLVSSLREEFEQMHREFLELS